MVALKLVGQGAFVVASLVLALRLLLLWRRTREVPELAIGIAFLFGGGFGYLAWLALGLSVAEGASYELQQKLTLLGLASTCIGAVSLGVGTALIFRPGARWPLVFVGAVAAWMAGAWLLCLTSPPERATVAFWAGALGTMPIYTWMAGESFALARVLHRRARLGMADPMVVNRIAQLGVSGAVVAIVTGLYFVSRLLHGASPPDAVSAVGSGLCTLAAIAIWLGFFPVPSLRERLAKAYQS